MKKQARTLIIFCLALAALGISSAQDTGQICVLSFEDRNGNRNFDENEPPITQGIGVNLQGALDITVETRLLEVSPRAVMGLVCFEDVAAGEYRVMLTSAQYEATTDTFFDAVVVPGSAPVRFDFGVRPRPVVVEAAVKTPGQLSDEQLQALQGIGIGLIGFLLISLIMLLIGWLIYWLVFRRRLKRIRAQQAQKPPSPSKSAPLPQSGLAPSSAPAQTPAAQTQFIPGQGSPLLFADDDTSPNPVT